MSIKKDKATPTVNSLLIKTSDLTKKSVLATAKVAGRATHLTQEGALAMVREAVNAVVWTNDRILPTARLLNPFSRVKLPRLSKTFSGRISDVPVRRIRKTMRTAFSREDKLRPKLKRPAVKSHAAQHPRVKENAPPPEIIPAEVTARKAFEKEEESKPKLKRLAVKSQAAQLPRAKEFAPPPEITPEDVTAAVFAGVTEKVRFSRALKDLAHEDVNVRNSAANILGNIHHVLSVRALCVHLTSEPCAEVRKECVNSLTVLEAKEGLSAVERALSDRSSDVRLAAVRGIYRLAGTEGATSLIRMFSDENEDVRRRAATCTGWLRQKHLAVALQPLLYDNSPFVRVAVLEALGNLKSFAVLSEVIELLNDPEETVRKKAFEALQAITGNQMVKAYPEDENERQLLIARCRVWQQEESLASCKVLA